MVKMTDLDADERALAIWVVISSMVVIGESSTAMM